jgi:hypothetical protein
MLRYLRSLILCCVNQVALNDHSMPEAAADSAIDCLEEYDVDPRVQTLLAGEMKVTNLVCLYLVSIWHLAPLASTYSFS